MEGDGFFELIFFKEAGEDGLRGIVNLVSTHDDVHRDIVLVEYLNRIASFVFDDVPGDKGCSHVWQILIFLKEAHFLFNGLHALFNACCVLS